MSKVSDSLKLGIDNKCSFCNKETLIGGYYNCEEGEIVVCTECIDKLIHLYIDASLDCTVTVGHMGLELECLNVDNVSKKSDCEIIADYLGVKAKEIAKNKDEIFKDIRYRQFLKLKEEFEGDK